MMHVQWIMFLLKFSFVIKHKAGKCHIVADALSSKINLTISIKPLIIIMKLMQNQYVDDVDFVENWQNCMKNIPLGDFSIKQDLFKGNPKTSLRDQLFKEMHLDGLAAHANKDKTLAQLQTQFYWPKIRRNVC